MTKHHKHRERRRHRRIRKPAIVRFHVKSEEHPVKHHSEWNMGAVLNIGAGGLLFYYDKKVDVDSLLHLKIYLHNPETSINCIGKVIRV
ncbi:MAG: PilZ domain-containing protein [Candidatus Omnitrophota bacterium]